MVRPGPTFRETQYILKKILGIKKRKRHDSSDYLEKK